MEEVCFTVFSYFVSRNILIYTLPYTYIFILRIGACLFSSICFPLTKGVGASAAIFGFISVLIGYILMNWKSIDSRMNNTSKFSLLINITFFIIFNLAVGFTSDNIDNMGHIGGLIYGFFLIWVIQKPDQPGDGVCIDNNIMFYICLVVTGVLYIVLGVLFFVVIKT